MTTPRRECDDEFITVSNPDRILFDGRQNSAASRPAHAFGNPPIALLSLETVLEEVATLLPRARAESMFDAIAD